MPQEKVKKRVNEDGQHHQHFHFRHLPADGRDKGHNPAQGLRAGLFAPINSVDQTCKISRVLEARKPYCAPRIPDHTGVGNTAARASTGAHPA